MKKLLLATAIALGFASGAQAATPWPLGAFLEGIEQGGSGFANQMATWVPLMGQRPVIGDMYIYYADPPSSWYSDANTELDSAKNNSCWMGTGTGACAGSPMEPMVGIPMGSSASGYDSTTSEIDSVLHEYFSGGALESTVRHVVDEAKADGFTHIAVRPGIEINLSSTAGGPQGNTTLEADYITAFRQIYTDLKSEGAAQGVTVDVVWNPGAAADNADGDIFNTLWPGASYVDIIAADFYDDPFPFGYPNYWDFYNSGNTSVGSQNFPGSGAYDGSSLQAMYNATPGSWENGTGNSTPPNAHDTINQEEYYSYPSSGNGGQDETGTPSLADSVLQLMAFAKAQGKPFGLAETGAGNGATHGDGLVDNSVFPAWLAGVLKTYTGTVAWVVIWTNTDSGEIYNFLDGTKPHEAAAWAANFGTTATGGGGGTGGGGATSPANTQVNGTEGEIYDTSGNEWTLVGGVLDRNGVATPSTGLTSEFWTGSVLYILSAGSGWYTVNLANGDGTSATVPTGYIAPHATSAANTDITGTSGTLYDTSGIPWTINSSQQIVRGDAIVPSSAQVVTLYWTGSAFDQLNSSGSWYTQPLDGSAGVATTAPAGYSAPSGQHHGQPDDRDGRDLRHDERQALHRHGHHRWQRRADRNRHRLAEHERQRRALRSECGDRWQRHREQRPDGFGHRGGCRYRARWDRLHPNPEPGGRRFFRHHHNHGRPFRTLQARRLPPSPPSPRPRAMRRALRTRRSTAPAGSSTIRAAWHGRSMPASRSP